jgi:hypothetical protein
MAKARPDEACERRLTTPQLRRLNLRSVPVAVGWDFEPGSDPRRRTGVVGVELWAEIRRRKSRTWPSSRPARGRSAGVGGSPVGRFGVGLLGGHGRAVGPAGADPHASRYRDGSCRPRPASRAQCPVSSDRPQSRSRGRRRWLRIGSRAHPAPPARSSALPASAGAIPADGGRSSGSNSSPPAAAAVTSRFRYRPPSSGPRAWASSEPAGVAPAAWPRSFPRSQSSWRNPRPLAAPGQVAWAVATFARALERAKVAVLPPDVGASTPEWGLFRTLNWTLTPKAVPQRERRADRPRAQNPRISRQNQEVARARIELATPRFSVVCSTD